MFHSCPINTICIYGSSREKYNLSGARGNTFCDNADMVDSDETNAGPNHLAAWREFAGLSQEKLAELVGTSQGMIGHLETDRRQLTAKWLRRLAPVLGTTPGWLLDHDPKDIPRDIFDMWRQSDEGTRRQIVSVMAALVKPDGTNG